MFICEEPFGWLFIMACLLHALFLLEYLHYNDSHTFYHYMFSEAQYVVEWAEKQRVLGSSPGSDINGRYQDTLRAPP